MQGSFKKSATPRRSRLAGEEALEPCVGLEDAFAGEPAPTVCVMPWLLVGAGLPAKRPPSLVSVLRTLSLASQLLRGMAVVGVMARGGSRPVAPWR
ncbi:hypothetical protein EAG75_06660 [Pseudomonas protegens]|nr:hypothetical protein EAG75_06660 [Pseudomonas protegens]